MVSMDQSVAPNYFDNLSIEMIAEVFNQLENRDLLNVSVACQLFYNILNQERGVPCLAQKKKHFLDVNRLISQGMTQYSKDLLASQIRYPKDHNIYVCTVGRRCYLLAKCHLFSNHAEGIPHICSFEDSWDKFSIKIYDRKQPSNRLGRYLLDGIDRQGIWVPLNDEDANYHEAMECKNRRKKQCYLKKHEDLLKSQLLELGFTESFSIPTNDIDNKVNKIFIKFIQSDEHTKIFAVIFHSNYDLTGRVKILTSFATDSKYFQNKFIQGEVKGYKKETHQYYEREIFFFENNLRLNFDVLKMQSTLVDEYKTPFINIEFKTN